MIPNIIVKLKNSIDFSIEKKEKGNGEFQTIWLAKDIESRKYVY